MAAIPQPQSDAHSPLRVSLWHNRDFLLLWGGQIVSSVGTRVSQLAFPLLVLAITGSPAQAGLIGGLRGVPYALLILPAGALIDRWDRKRVMIVADAGRAIALGSIPLAMMAGRLSIAQLGLVALVEGTLFTFFNLAEAACLPRVVRKDQIQAAVSLNSGTDAGSQVAGPSLGGALYAAGHGIPFLTDAISYLASVISLFFIRTEFQGARGSEGVPDDGARAPGKQRLWHEVWEGMVWLWREPLMRFLALLIGGLNLLSFGFTLIVIVLAQHMHASSFEIGLVFAGGGVGSIAGSVLAAPLERRFGFGPTMIGAAWLWVLTWPVYLLPSLWAVAAGNTLGFIAATIFMITVFSYRLSVTPDELQGRVNAVYKLLAFGCEPVSLALTGALIQGFGAVATIWIIMAPQLVLAALATVNGHLRRAVPLAELQAASSAGASPHP